MRALDAWEASGRRGVVEAVTGAGKTRVALAACADVLRAGGTCAIVVPTKELMRQWESEVRRHVIRAARLDPRVGFMGGGHHSTLSKSDIVICTAQSGSAYFLEPRAPALIVADECHHYGADTWSAVLEDGFDRRLGLTATYEREDNGVRDLLDPYFDGVCYSVDYTEALADGVIAPFKLAFVGARFRPGEAEAYDEAASKAGRYRAKLINEWGLPAEPFGAFMKAVNRLRHASEPEGSRLAGFYLSAFTKRRAIMAEASAKLDRVVELAPAIKRAERTIAFAQTKSAAARVVALLGRVGVDGAVLTSDLDMDDRSGIFAGFEDGTHELVAAPKLLDEGIDVPAADLAFIVATSRSRRQLVQRMGRVVRVKKDARPARVVILYVENTAEDPETGAHEDFLEIVEDAAEDVRTFDADSLAADINHYLNTW
jgi:RNA polymerase primary sigma factor